MDPAAGHGEQVLFATARALAECETLEDAAPRMLKAICDAVGWQYGAIWEVDRGRNVLRCIASWHSPDLPLDEFGTATRMLGAVIRNTTNPTMLGAGYKVNVIPTEATAHVDGRFLPGFEDEFFDTLAELCGENIDVEWVSKQQPWEVPYEGELVDAMARSVLAEDPDGIVAPYLFSGGTDAKHFKKLGMRAYGFAPLRLPDDLDFTALFHGVDERVPVDALEFGARVFDRFLDEV